QLEGDGLVFGDRLAEGAALLGVADGQLEGAQGDAAGAGGDVDPADLDAVHHVRETPAGFAAEDRVGADAKAVEQRLGGVDALVAHLVDPAGDGETGQDLTGALRLVDQEGGEVLVRLVLPEIRFHQHRGEIGGG